MLNFSPLRKTTLYWTLLGFVGMLLCLTVVGYSLPCRTLPRRAMAHLTALYCAVMGYNFALLNQTRLYYTSL